jgi:carbon monoxide dehydrogenase subunit G
MRFSHDISVAAPADELFALVSDPEQVVRCLPGASLEGRDGDHWRGAMSMKVGPINASYRGTLRFDELDPEARRAVMRVRADEASGQGQAEARIVSEIEEGDGAARIRMETDLQIRGKVAQFGRGAMEQLAGRMLERFAANVEEAIAGGGAPAGGDAPTAAPGDDAPDTITLTLPRPRVPSGVIWALAGGALGFGAGFLIGRSQ